MMKILAKICFFVLIVIWLPVWGQADSTYTLKIRKKTDYLDTLILMRMSYSKHDKVYNAAEYNGKKYLPDSIVKNIFPPNISFKKTDGSFFKKPFFYINDSLVEKEFYVQKKLEYEAQKNIRYIRKVIDMDSNIILIGEYCNNQLVGAYEKYYPNGQLQVKGQASFVKFGNIKESNIPCLKKNNYIGEWSFYREDGSLFKKEIYTKTFFLEKILYYDKNNVLKKEEWFVVPKNDCKTCNKALNEKPYGEEEIYFEKNY